MATGRIITLVLKVADLERSLHFYRDFIGVPLRADLDHGGAAQGSGDRWISGGHAAYSWREGAFLHFALYKEQRHRHERGSDRISGRRSRCDACETDRRRRPCRSWAT